MLEHFPDPYPDEVLYSVCARFKDHSGYPDQQNVFEELFGNRRVRVSIDLPCSLGSLVTRLPFGHKYTVDYLVEHHTLLPFYRPFLPPEQYDQIKQRMVTGGLAAIHRRAGIGGSGILAPLWLRYCPACIEEDRANFGECYWHRLHQVPGVEICPTHKIFLENSAIRSRYSFNKYDIVSAGRGAVAVVPRTAMSSPFFHVLMSIATDACYLLEHLIDPHDALFFRQQYRALLAQRGFMTIGRKIRSRDYLEAFIDHYSQDLLNGLHCGMQRDGKQTSRWLARLTHLPRQNQTVHNPLYHILAVRFLGSRAEAFFQENMVIPPPFGDGPWPCLNPACEYYLQRKILTYRLCEGKGKQKIVGQFTCSCGYTYNRYGPDASNADPFRKGKVYSYGIVWETRLCELWLDSTVPTKGIAKSLGVCIQTLYGHATRLHLPIPRRSFHSTEFKIQPQSAIKDLSWYRTRWLAVLEEAPGASISVLKHKVRRIYRWLRSYDKEWLDQHCPAEERPNKQPASRSLGERGPSHYRIREDALAAEAVRTAASKLMKAPGYPVRISLTKICRDIPQLRWKPRLNGPSLTEQALREVVETHEAFAIRKIKWALERYIEMRICPQQAEFTSQANLRKWILRDPGIQQALTEAMDVLSQFG